MISSDSSEDERGLQRPIRLSHDYTDHPLLTMDALAELADEMPPESIELSLPGGGPVASIDYRPPPLVGAASAALWDVEGNRRSIYLNNVEHATRYREMVDEAIEAMIDLLAVVPADVLSREGYIFRAGGGGTATTSAHVDHECNFLLVTGGHKRVWISDVPNEQSERALESLHSGRYWTCSDLPAEMSRFDLGAGEGVYIPPRAAHYVKSGPDPCTALSVVFLHRQTSREVPIYAVNSRLRRFGLTPRPPGESVMRDQAKRMGFRVAAAPRRLVRSVRSR